eukprot:149107_1
MQRPYPWLTPQLTPMNISLLCVTGYMRPTICDAVTGSAVDPSIDAAVDSVADPWSTPRPTLWSTHQATPYLNTQWTHCSTPQLQSSSTCTCRPTKLDAPTIAPLSF